MKFQFFNELAKQPDLQDVIQEIINPLQILDNLKSRLDNLPVNDLKSAAFAETSSKVDRLINKHFPNLTEDYCKLSLDYRNTAIIKKEKFEGKEYHYTSKDILLKNFSKLIEEIHVLEHEFNDNYSHKLLVAHRIVDQMGIQKKVFTTENEIDNIKPVVLKNNFDYEHFKKSQPAKVIPTLTPKIVLDKPPVVEKVKPTKETTVNSGYGIGLIEVLLAAGCISVAIVPVMVASKKTTESSQANHVIYEIDSLNKMINKNYLQIIAEQNPDKQNRDYKDINALKIKEIKLISPDKIIEGKYKNAFDGEVIISPETLQKSHDSYSITITNIPQSICPKVVAGMKDNPNAKVLVNNTVVATGYNIDVGQLVTACSIENNNIKMITQ